MKMFLLGALCAWVLLAILAFMSEEIIKNGGIVLFDGWASYILTLPLIPLGFLVAFIKVMADPFYRKNFFYKLKKLFKKKN